MDNETLRQQLQVYFDRVYPGSKIEDDYSLGGQVHIRFELGGELENGTIERVTQATDRALTLFNDTFDNPDHDVWVLMYEYGPDDIWYSFNDYLHQQFLAEIFTGFYNQIEKTEDDEIGIIIGKLSVKEINIQNILNGIANLEMGLEPKVGQRVFFFDPLTDKAFQMYDDRGCYIWSDNADKIRDIYLRRNEWIVDFHRPEIDRYFL